MIQEITEAATEAGIVAIVSDSKTKLVTQLNVLTKKEDSPILLISWDIGTTVEFDSNGFLKAPRAKIVFMLFEKPEKLEKAEYKDSSVEMQGLFYEFIQLLYPKLSKYRRSVDERNISEINTKLIPVQPLSHHSGVNGSFSMVVGVNRVCDG